VYSFSSPILTPNASFCVLFPGYIVCRCFLDRWWCGNVWCTDLGNPSELWKDCMMGQFSCMCESFRVTYFEVQRSSHEQGMS
jgi:hypothetical protein